MYKYLKFYKLFKNLKLLADDYDSDQAPRVSDFFGNVIDGEPLSVTLNLDIQSFEDIDTTKMSFR